MKFFALIACAAAIRVSEVPQNVAVPNGDHTGIAAPTGTPLPNRLTYKKDTIPKHAAWPSAPVATPVPLSNGHYGVGDRVTA